MLTMALGTIIGMGTVGAATTPTAHCLGQTPAACRAILSRHVTVLFTNFDKSPIPKVTVDVNGKETGKPVEVTLWVRLPKEDKWQQRTINLTLDRQGVVRRAVVQVFGYPTLAKTEEEFDRMGISPLLAGFLPSGCPERERLTFYRAFLNQIRPTVRTTKSALWAGGGDGVDTTSQESAKVNLCDVFVSFRRESGISTYRVSSTSSGKFDDREVVFELPN